MKRGWNMRALELVNCQRLGIGNLKIKKHRTHFCGTRRWGGEWLHAGELAEHLCARIGEDRAIEISVLFGQFIIHVPEVDHLFNLEFFKDEFDGLKERVIRFLGCHEQHRSTTELFGKTCAERLQPGKSYGCLCQLYGRRHTYWFSDDSAP